MIKAYPGTSLSPSSRGHPCWEGRCQPEGGDFPPSGACVQSLPPCSFLSVLGVRAHLGDGQRALASLNARPKAHFLAILLFPECKLRIGMGHPFGEESKSRGSAGCYRLCWGGAPGWEEGPADRKRKMSVKWLRAVWSDSRIQPLTRHLTAPGHDDLGPESLASLPSPRTYDTAVLREQDEDSGSAPRPCPSLHSGGGHSRFLGHQLREGPAEGGNKAQWARMAEEFSLGCNKCGVPGLPGVEMGRRRPLSVQVGARESWWR